MVTGLFAAALFFLTHVHGWLGTLWWIAVILFISWLALRFAPRLEAREHDRSIVTVPFFVAVVGFFLLFMLVEQPGIRWATWALAVFVVFVVLHTLYRSEVPEAFRVRRLIPIMRMALYAGLYSLFAAAFGITIFLGLPIWFFAIIVWIASGLSGWSLMRLADKELALAVPCAIIVALLIFELFWIISFLPIAYPIQGWLLVSSLYAIVQGILWHLHRNERLQLRSRNRLILAIAAALLVALIARWV